MQDNMQEFKEKFLKQLEIELKEYSMPEMMVDQIEVKE